MENDSQPTQPTQPFTDPRRLGFNGSGMSEDDITDVICILIPSSPSAHDAVAATQQLNKNHIFPNDDLVAEEEESLYDPDMKLQDDNRELALRISSPVKNQHMGFTFGRYSAKCDILLSRDIHDIHVSNRHFRIYVNPDGVLMLQDTSTNGTLVDDKHLKYSNDTAAEDSTRMLQNGTIICVLRGPTTNIKFLVRIPTRGAHQEAYNLKLGNLLAKQLGTKSNWMVSVHENNYGMHWNGGSIYNVVGFLGKGAFATVYKLATKKDGRVYAAKELDKRRFMKNNVLDIKFDNELKIMRDLRHPNIVQYEDYQDYEDWVYIIMENVPGGELSMYLHKHGPMAESTVQTIARQILHALAYLHARGITHRDIKPDNILISGLDPLQVKLSDFGLSKCVTNQETFLKTFCGTLLYCAPEIYPGFPAFEEGRSRKRTRLKDGQPKTYSQRVDMWSLGAVLFHVLCDRAPYTVEADEQNKAQAMLAVIMTTDVDLNPLRERFVSEQGIDFISELLKRNPSLRPSPKACFEHAWISEVADQLDYVDLDNEMPAYRGQGLAPVAEADEEGLTGSEEAVFNELLSPPDVTFGYLNTAGKRVSKRQRVTAKANQQAMQPPTDRVTYPALPDDSPPTQAAAAPQGQRLFGEITSSVLRSSGVFAGEMPAIQEAEARRLSPHEDWETSGDNDQADTSGMGDFDAPPSFSGSVNDSNQSPPIVKNCPALKGRPNPSSSLLGADVQIGRLQVTSPAMENPHTPPSGPANPAFYAQENGTPVVPDQVESQELASDKIDDSVQARAFSRFIDIQVPSNVSHDSEFVKGFIARQNATKEQRLQKAKAKAFRGIDNKQEKTARDLPDAETKIHKEPPEGDADAHRDPKTHRHFPSPALGGLQPARQTNTNGRTNGLAKPLQKLGKLTTVPGSFIDTTIWINSRLTSWGRGPKCNVPYENRNDTRVPLYAIQITYHAPGIENRIETGQPWETTPGIHTVISTGTSGCIWVNDVELRRDCDIERCRFYGKVYSGDIITVYRSAEAGGPFLSFTVQINYGDSARHRPEQELGFQVLKDTYYHRRELRRRKSLN